MLKNNVLCAATEGASMILSVDQTIKNPKSEQAQADARKKASGRGALPGMGGRGGQVMGGGRGRR